MYYTCTLRAGPFSSSYSTPVSLLTHPRKAGSIPSTTQKTPPSQAQHCYQHRTLKILLRGEGLNRSSRVARSGAKSSFLHAPHDRACSRHTAQRASLRNQIPVDTHDALAVSPLGLSLLLSVVARRQPKRAYSYNTGVGPGFPHPHTHQPAHPPTPRHATLLHARPSPGTPRLFLLGDKNARFSDGSFVSARCA